MRQMDMLENEVPMEQKEDVFYVRCRPQVKRALMERMQEDGWKSMADWFDQFVQLNFIEVKSAKRKTKKRS